MASSICPVWNFPPVVESEVSLGRQLSAWWLGVDEVFIYWSILHCGIAALVWVAAFAFTLNRRLKRMEVKVDRLISLGSRCLDCGATCAVVLDDDPLCLSHAESRLGAMRSKQGATVVSHDF